MAATAATASAFATAQADDKASGVAASAVDRRDPGSNEGNAHNLEGPFSKQQDAQRQAALEQVISGDKKVSTRGGSNVVKLDDKKYVELGREKTDKIFTILVEFGDKVDNTTMFDPDGDGPKPAVPKYGGTAGPAHNKIAKPDPKKDNSTAWQADYNQAHFQDLYFGTGAGKNSLKTYYEKTSSGRYSVDGEVSDWVKVPYNEARYGSNWCGSTNCANAWDMIKDGTNAWAADQKAKGRTPEQIKTDLAQYDQWDRYDFDGDGNFNEPDGYIDHFQIVHMRRGRVHAAAASRAPTPSGRTAGTPTARTAGATGPAENKAGGTQIGDTGIWVGDYTAQPENGGLGVFAHEYGHDLGLPDLYDTTNTAENSVGFWSLMSAGSWLGTGKNSIGDLPGDMTAWDKLQLGWLNYAEAKAATKSTHKLGVSEYNTKDKQALVVTLPDKAVTTDVTAPAEGAKQWWSDMGDNLSNTLSRPVDLTGKSKASLDLMRLVGHRGGLRLPLHRGLRQRRHQLDRDRRHRRRQGDPARRQ